MIDDLDRSVEALLRRELEDSVLQQVSISFAQPDGEFPPQSVKLPAIDLFLYDVRENRELRSNEWLVEQQNDKFIRSQPLVRVDCSYLVTAWASESSPTPAFDEHRLIGDVMMVLLAHPVLPEEILQGRLRAQEPPLPAISLQPTRLQSLGEFWQAMGGKPKPAFDYTVTIALSPFAATEAGIVREMELVVDLKTPRGKQLLEKRSIPFRKPG